ncbi:hypothetical protein GCM10023319_03380 [Nocardia iowensis]
MQVDKRDSTFRGQLPQKHSGLQTFSARQQEHGLRSGYSVRGRAGKREALGVTATRAPLDRHARRDEPRSRLHAAGSTRYAVERAAE